MRRCLYFSFLHPDNVVSQTPFWYKNCPGCGGIESKAQAMFDETEPNSALTKLCDGPDALANCDLGVATSGWSQGAQIASLGMQPSIVALIDLFCSLSHLFFHTQLGTMVLEYLRASCGATATLLLSTAD